MFKYLLFVTWIAFAGESHVGEISAGEKGNGGIMSDSDRMAAQSLLEYSSNRVFDFFEKFEEAKGLFPEVNFADYFSLRSTLEYRISENFPKDEFGIERDCINFFDQKVPVISCQYEAILSRQRQVESYFRFLFHEQLSLLGVEKTTDDPKVGYEVSSRLITFTSDALGYVKYQDFFKQGKWFRRPIGLIYQDGALESSADNYLTYRFSQCLVNDIRVYHSVYSKEHLKKYFEVLKRRGFILLEEYKFEKRWNEFSWIGSNIESSRQIVIQPNRGKNVELFSRASSKSLYSIGTYRISEKRFQKSSQSKKQRLDRFWNHIYLNTPVCRAGISYHIERDYLIFRPKHELPNILEEKK